MGNTRRTQNKVLCKPARASPINSHRDTKELEEHLLWGYKDTSIGEIVNPSLFLNLVAMCMFFVLQNFMCWEFGSHGDRVRK